MVRRRKIKLKGSSFFDKRKPINKRRNSSSYEKEGILFINKSSKAKNNSRKDNGRPYSNVSRNNTSSRYLPDIIDRRYIFVVILIFLCFFVIIGKLVKL